MDTGRAPMETFHDGYVVNAVVDACYRSATSRQWEPIELADWRAQPVPKIKVEARQIDGQIVIKEERMPDGAMKRILRNRQTGQITQTIE
jgi:hypothetical protein